VQAECGGRASTSTGVSFGDLADPVRGGTVAIEAAAADLVVVAIDWERPVSYAAINWFFTWPEERSQFGGTLLLLAPAPERGAALWRGYFDHIAASGGMEFWCEWDGMPLESVLLRRASGVRPRAEEGTAGFIAAGCPTGLAAPGG
jgi:hypothetical protein